MLTYKRFGDKFRVRAISDDLSHNFVEVLALRRRLEQAITFEAFGMNEDQILVHVLDEPHRGRLCVEMTIHATNRDHELTLDHAEAPNEALKRLVEAGFYEADDPVLL